MSLYQCLMLDMPKVKWSQRPSLRLSNHFKQPQDLSTEFELMQNSSTYYYQVKTPSWIGRMRHIILDQKFEKFYLRLRHTISWTIK